MIGAQGQENKQLKKCQINFKSINFKVFEYYLVQDIELKYIFDDSSIAVMINKIPIQVDVISVYKLFQMNLMSDIDYFF